MQNTPQSFANESLYASAFTATFFGPSALSHKHFTVECDSVNVHVVLGFLPFAWLFLVLKTL